MEKKVKYGSLKHFWKHAPEGRYLNLKEILNLGVASLGVSFITNLVNLFVTIGHLPIIYDMGKYGTLHATIVSLISCIGGMILTPLYAKAIQRTNTKYGRYKPYLLILSPIVALFGALAAWSPQNLSETETIVYVYMICVPTLLVWNLWFNTWNFFPGVFTPNQEERVSVWAPIGIIMGLAPTLMHLLKHLLEGYLGDIVTARVFGISSAVLGVLCVLCLLSVKERVIVTEEEHAENKISVKTGLKMVFKNKPLIILMLFSILGCMRTTIDLNWNIVSRIKYADNMADGAKLCGVISLIVGFAATPNLLLMPYFTKRANNKTIMLIWSGLNTLAYLALAIIGFDKFEPGTVSAVIITVIRFVASFNAMASLQTLMVSEIGDYQQYLTGYRLDGFIQTLVYSVPLVATQLFAIIPAIIQAELGFSPYNYQIIAGSSNIVSTELMNKADEYFNIAIWISTASGVLAFIAMCFYPLSKNKYREIMEVLRSKATNIDELEKSKGIDDNNQESEAHIDSIDANITCENGGNISANSDSAEETMTAEDSDSSGIDGQIADNSSTTADEATNIGDIERADNS